ncbi:hypothetical protein COX64_02720 [Candidatus Dojkabacteria bacterium CG_4_10_14_0_2_um_filter_Dojkabacteria_WS6_41_15]|uniref:Uncharacterized protein n=1 Tax=Candidatus Dojkabacteria bacterium CG_4_10_14_0_2_um_filter_Dojkabacteria_WS6_41_15 TaxID=2014249 RepID=A0A2M7W1U5_9BACT|nr:MAG: hypothetical protein COX64_02720 [Candidatus Dojkabacteria bacterium CG_4_10_14_0_2_um_filter_Dojkabacteria_WS6_41_15]
MKKKKILTAWLPRILLILQSMLVIVLFLHPRVPQIARVLVCGGMLAFLIVMYGWAQLDFFLRGRIDAFLVSRGASLFTIRLARAVLYLIEFGLVLWIIVPALLRVEDML